MQSRLILLGTTDHLEEAVLLLTDQHGRQYWQHYEFTEDGVDATFQRIMRAKQQAGVEQVAITCAATETLEGIAWPDLPPSCGDVP